MTRSRLNPWLYSMIDRLLYGVAVGVMVGVACFLILGSISCLLVPPALSIFGLDLPEENIWSIFSGIVRVVILLSYCIALAVGIGAAITRTVTNNTNG